MHVVYTLIFVVYQVSCLLVKAMRMVAMNPSLV